VCSERVSKKNSTGRLKCAKMNFLMCSAAGRVIGGCEWDGCTVGGKCGTELESEKDVLWGGSVGLSWRGRRMYCGWEVWD
jgi:hypothetical protein